MNTSTESGGGEESSTPTKAKTPPHIDDGPLEPVNGQVGTYTVDVSAKDEDPDPVIFAPPDPVLFSTDPDPTCNNGFIKLFFS